MAGSGVLHTISRTMHKDVRVSRADQDVCLGATTAKQILSGKRKNPRHLRVRGLDLKPGSVLLSHGNSHTIIGAKQFHF